MLTFGRFKATHKRIVTHLHVCTSKKNNHSSYIHVLMHNTMQVGLFSIHMHRVYASLHVIPADEFKQTSHGCHHILPDLDSRSSCPRHHPDQTKQLVFSNKRRNLINVSCLVYLFIQEPLMLQFTPSCAPNSYNVCTIEWGMETTRDNITQCLMQISTIIIMIIPLIING